MSTTISVPPLSWVARCADAALTPIMYALSGILKERPQRTHFYNNKKLSEKEKKVLNRVLMSKVSGDPTARTRWLGFVPIFHIPILGGWRKYVVVEPPSGAIWHVGWVAGDVAGVSRVALKGSVRLLVGPKETLFFGVDSRTGIQIPVSVVGEGSIGDGGPHKKLPLL